MIWVLLPFSLYYLSLYIMYVFISLYIRTYIYHFSFFLVLISLIYVFLSLSIYIYTTNRFDELRPGEPAIKLSGKKRAFRDNIKATTADKVRHCSSSGCGALIQLLLLYCSISIYQNITSYTVCIYFYTLHYLLLIYTTTYCTIIIGINEGTVTLCSG